MAPSCAVYTLKTGASIAVYGYGADGDKPTLLVTHGNGFCARASEPLLLHLAAAFRVLAVDMRGHGRSTMPAGAPVTWAAHAADLLELVDKLGLRGCALFGHSLGGGAALRAEGMRPGTFRAMALFEPIAPPPSFMPVWRKGTDVLEAVARRRRRRFDSRDAARAVFASKPPWSETDPACLDGYVQHGLRESGDGGVELCCAPETEAAIYAASHADAGTFQGLRRVACPVLVVAGGRQAKEGPALIAPMIVAALPHGQLQIMERVGHLGPMEDVAGTAERALAFLLEGGSGAARSKL